MTENPYEELVNRLIPVESARPDHEGVTLRGGGKVTLRLGVARRVAFEIDPTATKFLVDTLLVGETPSVKDTLPGRWARAWRLRAVGLAGVPIPSGWRMTAKVEVDRGVLRLDPAEIKEWASLSEDDQARRCAPAVDWLISLASIAGNKPAPEIERAAKAVLLEAATHRVAGAIEALDRAAGTKARAEEIARALRDQLRGNAGPAEASK